MIFFPENNRIRFSALVHCFILEEEYSGTRVLLTLRYVLVLSLFRCQAPDVIKYAC